MNKSTDDLEKEIVDLKYSVKQAKYDKAEEVFTQRFVLTGIIFVIIFIVLVVLLSDSSVLLQWVSIIGFFVVALLVAGRIFNTYTRDKNDATK